MGGVVRAALSTVPLSAPQQSSEAPSTRAARSISSVSVCGLQVMLAKWSVCARTENDRPCLCGEREEGRDGERGWMERGEGMGGEEREDRGAHRAEDATSKASHPPHPPVSPSPALRSPPPQAGLWVGRDLVSHMDKIIIIK